jgi:hypothetical protein
MVSGVVPTLIYYGVQIIHPNGRWCFALFPAAKGMQPPQQQEHHNGTEIRRRIIIIVYTAGKNPKKCNDENFYD